MIKKTIFIFLVNLLTLAVFFSGLELGCRVVKRANFDKIPTYFDGFLAGELGKPVPKKNQGESRIFVFGSSAAFGTPVPQFSISSWMRKMFPVLLPGQKTKVINFAWPGKSSHQVLAGARYALKFQPDVFVIYTGNNEYIGSNRLFTDYWYYRLDRDLFYGSAFYRYLSLQIERVRRKLVYGRADAHEKRYREEIIAAKLYKNPAITEQDILKIHERYKDNLNQVLRLAKKKGITVVLLTVPVNIKDVPPGLSAHMPSLSSEKLAEWQTFFERGKKDQVEGKLAEAAEAFETAARIDPEYAETFYLLGQVLEAEGKTEEAANAYDHAVQHEKIAARAKPGLNAVIRGLCAEHPEALCLDTIPLLRKKASKGILSNEIFYDNVHPFGEIHQTMAVEILKLLSGSDKIAPGSDWQWAALESSRENEPERWKAEDKKEKVKQFFMLGLQFWNQRDYAKAIERLENGIKTESGFLEAYGFLADAYFHAGRKKEAADYFIRLAEKDAGLFARMMAQYPELQESYGALKINQEMAGQTHG